MDAISISNNCEKEVFVDAATEINIKNWILGKTVFEMKTGYAKCDQVRLRLIKFSWVEFPI